MFSNVSHLPNGSPFFSLDIFLHPHFYSCSKIVTSSFVFISYTITSFLLVLPLCGFVFYIGIQKWRRQHQTSTVNTMSHYDCLTFNIIIMEPIGLIGSGLYCLGILQNNHNMLKGGIYNIFIVYLCRLLFQCLTCVEQYLAVIHPVIYLKMKTERGIRIRNASIGCIWLLCFLMLFLLITLTPEIPMSPFLFGYLFGLVVVCFCTYSVLLALVRPGPGDTTGDRKRVSQTKRTAFLNIAILNSIILLKYFGLLFCTFVHASSVSDDKTRCAVLMSAFWFCLPSSTVIPLQFLHREGIIPYFRLKTEIG